MSHDVRCLDHNHPDWVDCPTSPPVPSPAVRRDVEHDDAHDLDVEHVMRSAIAVIACSLAVIVAVASIWVNTEHNVLALLVAVGLALGWAATGPGKPLVRRWVGRWSR